VICPPVYRHSHYNICSSYGPEGPARVGIRHTYRRLSACVYVQGSPAEIHNPPHWNLICRSITAPPDCVIAQQYSSAIFKSQRFHSCTVNFGVRVKHVFISLLHYICETLKPRSRRGDSCDCLPRCLLSRGLSRLFFFLSCSGPKRGQCHSRSRPLPYKILSVFIIRDHPVIQC
jgi:hypothetical protein